MSEPTARGHAAGAGIVTLPVDEVEDRPGGHPVLASTEHYRGAKWSVRAETVALPDGSEVERDLLAHPGSVGVVALDDRDRMLLVRQYRHPVAATLWEPPAGLLDVPGEDPLEAAKRELYEEAHHRAAQWSVLLDAYTTPGCSDEAVRLYLARELTPVPARERHEGEHEEADMPLAWVPLAEVVSRVLNGRLHNPLTTMGCLAALAAQASGYARLRPADSPWPERPVAGRTGRD